jgi:glucose-1-phosphate cytidylyltransferase
MKAVILAGGLGSRLSEETESKPKPLVTIGEQPILWHILKIYSFYGINEFIICCGYKGYMIKEYFLKYKLYSSDIEIDLSKDNTSIITKDSLNEKWKLILVDTGKDSQTGGRLKRVEKYLDKTFCMTYGDGLSSINIRDLINFHKKNKKLATMTVVNPEARFGKTELSGDVVKSFNEKPKIYNDWINGGFFVLEPKVFDYIKDDNVIWEDYPLKKLSSEKNLSAYRHNEFWQPMDTLRERATLENLWKTNKAPWKVW